MSNFGIHHGGHFVRHRPHAFADLCVAWQAAGQPDVYVPVFVSRYPRLGFHLSLADHGPGLHGGVYLITGSVQKTGIDKDHPVASRTDTFLEVDRSPALLVHNPDFDNTRVKSEGFFDSAKQLNGKGDFFGAVHFRFNDIDRSGSGVLKWAAAVQVVQGDQTGDHGIHNAFKDFVTLSVENGRVGHQVTDVSNQHQRAARQGQAPAVGSNILTVRIERSVDGAAALVEPGREVTFHQSQPVLVDTDFLFSVHGRHRILQVLDGGDGRFQDHITDAGWTCAADQMIVVDPDLDVQVMVSEHDAAGLHRIAAEARQLFRLGEAALGIRVVCGHQSAIDDCVARDIGVRDPVKRYGLVEKNSAVADHPLAADRVIGATYFCAIGFGQHVRTVQCVVQRTPSRVRSVERVTGIVHRYYQLRPGNGGDLVVYLGCSHAEVGAFFDQIADLPQKCAISYRVVRVASV